MNINKLKLLLPAIVCIVSVNNIYANPHDDLNSKSSYDLNTDLHLSTLTISNDSQIQNKTEHLTSPVFHFSTETNTEAENVVNSTIVFSDNYSVIDTQSQNVSIQSIDNENLSEIATNAYDDESFFSDEEEGNELVESLYNNIDKSETKDHSGNNSY